MHRTTMDSLVILFLIGAGLHLTSSAETADDTSGGRYTKPNVYPNLPPPVIYFPNFPEKQKISERGDNEDKRLEYLPFPFKDLPLLVYHSDKQPSVHVVKQRQAIGGSDAVANQPWSSQPPCNDGKHTQQSGSSVYMQSNGQQYQNIQMGKVEQQNANPSTYSTAQDTFPDLQNHQFISIGLSAIHDYLGNAVFPTGQPPANPTSQSQVPNSQSYGMQITNQYPQQQGQNVANHVPPPQTHYFVRQNGGQQNSQAPTQYSVQSSQQPANSYQNTNTKVSSQTQQNMISQYAQGTPIQYQSQMQSVMQENVPQMQQEQGYLNQNKAQIQYVQNNQQQNVAYDQNSPQAPYNAMQQAFDQQAGDTNVNVNSIQYVSNKVMGQNVYQQNQQSQPEPQMESSADNASGENDPQYIRIAVYPYGAIDPNQLQEPDQFYKIVIPQPNDEDDDEDEQNEENANSMEVNSGKTQVTNQVQGSRYRGSSSAVGQNSKQQRPFYANSYQQRLPNKMNAANINKQQRNKEQTQKQTQKNSQENQIPEEPEYQQILIHIPHSIAASPQILVQPDDKDKPSPSYMGTVQGQKLRKPFSTNKKRQQPQLSSSNNGYQVTDYIHPATGSIRFNQRYARPKTLPRFPPINFVNAASSNYRNLFRVPFGHNVGRHASKPILPIGSAHPEVYASSHLHFTSLNPLFVPNPMRNRHRIPFNQASASMMRPPQILPSPLMPWNMFHSSYPDEMMAQASFPRITRGRKDDLNSTQKDISNNGFLNSDSSSESDRIIKSLAAKSTEAFLKQIVSDVQTHDMLDGVLGTSSANNPGVAAFNMPQLPDLLKLNYAGQVPNVPFLPIPHQSISISQSQGGGKYGNFMKKLAALSNSLIYQSLGMKPLVPFRDVTKVKHHSNEYSIEEIIDSVLPENASPRATIMKTDRIGASLPQQEFSKRVLNTEDNNADPSVIVYKGLKPPVEVYGNKDDIEASKEVDPFEASASELKATSRVADDIAETDPEKVFDYVDIMYSMLPDFIKHSIGQLNDDQLDSEWLPVNATSAPKINPKEEVSSNESKLTTDVKSTNSGKESSSAFKEDIEELSKLLHKEEKSDLMP